MRIPREELTPNMLKSILHYDENTGAFTWVKQVCSQSKLGGTAGWVTEFGYWRISAFYVRYAAHRLAWFYVHGKWPVGQIDHIDGNRLNNRMSNLREATQLENSQNSYKPSKNNKSGFLGVHKPKNSNKWIAMIRSNGRNHYLGQFLSAEDASKAYIEAKKQLHPFGAHITNPQFPAPQAAAVRF